MSRVSLQQFADDSCKIPSDVAPTTYGVGTVRWLYFVDRSVDRSGDHRQRNLRDLVLLPCNPNEIDRLYCVTLGIENTPGATAAGTQLMQDFGLSLKFEQAYDSLSGDVGSKTCVVVFPPNKWPEDFDRYVEERIQGRAARSQLIRRANDTRTRIQSRYSSDLDAYFGRYAMTRKLLPSYAEAKPIDEVTIQGEGGTINETPRSMALRLTDTQRRKVERFLAEAYGNDHGLEGRFVQLTCDTEFEALSFSFLDPDDVLCFLRLQFSGDTKAVNAVVEWLGGRGVDFRQYHIVATDRDSGYEFRLLCDLAQTDLHLFDAATLRELLFAELSGCLNSPRDHTRYEIRALDVHYINETLKLYDTFTEKDRFGLIALLFVDSGGQVVRHWPASLDQTAILDDEVKKTLTSAPLLSPVSLPNDPRRQVVRCTHAHSSATVAAVYDNRPPEEFLSRLQHFCQQVLPADDDAALVNAVRAHLLHDLRFKFVISRAMFEGLGGHDEDTFRKENDTRFSSLGWNYIQEKWERDQFAFRGNVTLAEMLGVYLTDNPTMRAKLSGGSGERIRILDIGPGVGALTSTMAIRRNKLLWDNRHRIDIVFVDASQQVLDLTRDVSGYRALPTKLLEDLQLSLAEDLASFIQLMSRAQYICADVSKPGVVEMLTQGHQRSGFDIVYSGFCHHHMNRAMKGVACETMMALARESAFVGIVDESLTYKQYLLYRIGHSLDQVAPAKESYFPSAKDHAELLGRRFQLKAVREGAGYKFYAFWGERAAITPQDKAGQDQAGLGVFISYARGDSREQAPGEDWVGKLREYLTPLVAQKKARVWSDANIDSGGRWHETIQGELAKARVAVLLIGPAFLGSEYIRNNELPAILMNARTGGTAILPVIVRPCDVEGVRFKYPDPINGPHEDALSLFQSVNSPKTPLNTMAPHEQDAVLLALANRIAGMFQP